MTKRVAPYGAWASPFTADKLVSSAVRLGFPSYDGPDLYWLEIRPQEQGRYVLVRKDASGVVSDAIPDTHSVRTLVHEYGGNCYTVGDGVLYYSNFDDQRVYRLAPGSEPQPITAEPDSPRAHRYADFVLTPDHTHLLAVRERHLADGVINDLVAIPTDGSSEPQVLASGHDFYAGPVVSPDGARLAWFQWDHPRMPWDGTELCQARLGTDLTIGDVSLVAGGETESVVQPKYGPDGTMYYISDRTNWWNLYAVDASGTRALAPMAADFAFPHWVLGFSDYAIRPDGNVMAVWLEGGISHLGVIYPDGAVRELSTEWTTLVEVSASPAGVVGVAGSPFHTQSVVEFSAADGSATVHRSGGDTGLAPEYVSVAQAIEFPTENGLTAHALYYPPTNPDFEAPKGSLPPVIVASHGGPTAHVESSFNGEIQYWTTRGFGVVDVNYGGSTGYGREYRERLKGNWGIVDLDDCVNAARYLADTGRADPNALLIHGGSAGGYTTLCALTFRDDFAAGASYFGVADLGALARDTHKFESRYLDGLVGPYPEREDLYQARSALFHTDLMRTPVILLQGLDDHVVPPAQAESMAAALRTKGVPFAYLPFEGEQHGFRMAQNIIRAAEAELWFYGQVLGFTPADDIEPVDIENAAALTR